MKTKTLLMLGVAGAIAFYFAKKKQAQLAAPVVPAPKPVGNYVLV